MFFTEGSPGRLCLGMGSHSLATHTHAASSLSLRPARTQTPALPSTR